MQTQHMDVMKEKIDAEISDKKRKKKFEMKIE